MSATFMALKPRMSEKTYALSKIENTYVFNVPVTANKKTVADAVEAQFKVSVESVRIVIVKGKVKQSYRKRSRPVTGKRADIKKAYVRVAEGDQIPVFDAIDQAAEQQEKTQEQAAKAAAKRAKKEAK